MMDFFILVNKFNKLKVVIIIMEHDKDHQEYMDNELTFVNNRFNINLYLLYYQEEIF